MDKARQHVRLGLPNYYCQLDQPCQKRTFQAGSPVSLFWVWPYFQVIFLTDSNYPNTLYMGVICVTIPNITLLSVKISFKNVPFSLRRGWDDFQTTF